LARSSEFACLPRAGAGGKFGILYSLLRVLLKKGGGRRQVLARTILVTTFLSMKEGLYEKLKEDF
jgi:hypothetical protein